MVRDALTAHLALESFVAFGPADAVGSSVFGKAVLEELRDRVQYQSIDIL